MNDRRRRVLAGLVAAVTGGAGCLDSNALGDGTATETIETTGTTETTTSGVTDTRGSTTGSGTNLDEVELGESVDVGGRSVRLQSARATRFLVTLFAGAHTSVSADRESQYVVVELDVDGEDPREAARRACELRVDDDAVDPVSEVVRPFEGRTYLAFSLSLDVAVDDLVLAWVDASGTATWRLPESVAAALASPPDFEVRSFSVPSTASDDEVEVSFSVANVGEGDGEFVAELGTRALSDQGEVRVDVPQGETRTMTETVGLVASVGDQPIVLDWGWDSLERTVSVPTTTE